MTGPGMLVLRDAKGRVLRQVATWWPTTTDDGRWRYQGVARVKAPAPDRTGTGIALELHRHGEEVVVMPVRLSLAPEESVILGMNLPKG